MLRALLFASLVPLQAPDPGAKPANGFAKEAEIFLADATKPPTSPVRVRVKRLPWPFPGKFADQRVFNNYGQATDDYVHGGIDILNEVGTEVRAVDGGWVACIATNYPDTKTHHFFVVASEKGGNQGWCYTHVDPDTYTFDVGERIERGEVLGRLVDFKVGASEGADHLHLNYVRFARKSATQVDCESLVDPLLFFEHADTRAPVILPELRFVEAGTLRELARTPGEILRVSGDVDVIAGISDAAYEGQGCNWGVPVVTLEIEGARAAPWRKLVLDLRGEIGDPRAGPGLFVKHADKQRWLEGVDRYPVVQFVIATHSDGDGRVEPADGLQCWSTGQTDAAGKPRFPDGVYEVTVRAFDLAGNRAERTVKVRVENP